MKKLLALTSAIVAGFATSASADVAVSGSGKIGVINDGAASSNKTQVQMGAAVAFDLSATTANGMTISTSMGLTRTTSLADDTAAVGGGNVFTFATDGMSMSIGHQKVVGRSTGAVGSTISDFMANETIASTAEVDLDDVKGQGVQISTSMGSASVAFSYNWDAAPNENKGSTDATTSQMGVSASIPMGDITLGVGYAAYDDSTTNNTTSGASIAYAVGGGTLTVGYQSTTELNNNGTSTSGNYKGSLDADTSFGVGYASIKEGANSSTKTTANLSRSLGGGASVFAEIDNRSGAGTTGTAFSVGTSVSF
jgi:hypothetical protein